MLLGLATIKPQLAAQLLAWFVLERRWRALLIGGVTAAACAAWPMLASGPGSCWSGWWRALDEYQRNTVAATGFRHVFGLRSALDSVGIAGAWVVALAPLAVALLFLQRARLAPNDPAPLLFALPALTLYAHDYDLAASVTLAAPLCARALGRPSLAVALALLAAVQFFPQRVWQRFELGQLARTHELALLALACAHIVLAARPARASEPSDQR